MKFINNNTKIMTITLNILLCLLNLSMALSNYKLKNYKNSMLSMFAAGFILGATIVLLMI